MQCRLHEPVDDAPIIDLGLVPKRVAEKNRTRLVLSTLSSTQWVLVLKPIKVLMEVVKLAVVLKQVLEGDRVRLPQEHVTGCGRNYWQFHDHLPFPAVVC